MKSVKHLLFVAIFTSTLIGETYTIKEGWNLKGAVNDINMLSEVEGVDSVWKYDSNGWQFNPIVIKKQEGYWVKALKESSYSDANDTLNVNIQVTGADNLESIMQELNSRGLVATIWLSAGEMNSSCEEIKSYTIMGHEIAGKYTSEITDETTYEEQLNELEQMLEISTKCIGEPIKGFRATKFTSNSDTHKLLDDENITYMMRSNRQVLLSSSTFRPYRFEGTNFSIVPMPVTVYFGEVGSLCDVSCSGDLGPAHLHQLQKEAIDMHLKLNEPLILEWHPALTYPNEPNNWWSNLIYTLDYLKSKGELINYITCGEIVKLYPPEGTREIDIAPWEIPSTCGCD